MASLQLEGLLDHEPSYLNTYPTENRSFNWDAAYSPDLSSGHQGRSSIHSQDSHSPEKAVELSSPAIDPSKGTEEVTNSHIPMTNQYPGDREKLAGGQEKSVISPDTVRGLNPASHQGRPPHG